MGGIGIPSGFFTRGNPKAGCKNLVIRTQLFSPAPAVLAKLAKGDKMPIVLLGQGGPCVAMYGSLLAGTVIHRDLLQLIECGNKGVDFEATVRDVLGGACLVTIKAIP